jgi:predicted Rossmann-fold nucleotide-binding protein
VSDDRPRCENHETLQVVEHALMNLWGVANDLSRIRPPTDRYRVTIFGSARTKPEDEIYGRVVELSRRLSELGCDIVTGGGPGLMQAANEGHQLGDPHDERESLGVRIALPFEQGSNPFVETVYTHRTFFTRLHQFMRLSNAFIVVDGGLGTTLETLLVWQLMQVQHVEDTPLVLVGDMWSDLQGWARRHMADRDDPLAGADEVDLPDCVDDCDAAYDLIADHYRAFEAARPR